MKELIKRLLRESLNNKIIFEESATKDTCDCCKYFDSNSYENYDGLQNPLYVMLSKSKLFQIKYIKPKQYLYSVATGFGVSYDDSMMHVSQERIEKYVQDMKNGDKFPIGYYEENKPNQEGRHRAAALLEIGCEIMPIVVLRDLTQLEVKKIAIKFKDYSKEQLYETFKNMGYHGISSLDWRELQNYINYRL